MSKRTAEQRSSEAGNKRRFAQSKEVDLTGDDHAEESEDLVSKMRRCLKETFGEADHSFTFPPTTRVSYLVR